MDDNRRTDHISSGAYSSIIIPMEWQCDCSYCPETRWIRFDYYPICAERGGRKITFESWCHFDCENKCVKHTGIDESCIFLLAICFRSNVSNLCELC